MGTSVLYLGLAALITSAPKTRNPKSPIGSSGPQARSREACQAFAFWAPLHIPDHANRDIRSLDHWRNDVGAPSLPGAGLNGYSYDDATLQIIPCTAHLNSPGRTDVCTYRWKYCRYGQSMYSAEELRSAMHSNLGIERHCCAEHA